MCRETRYESRWCSERFSPWIVHILDVYVYSRVYNLTNTLLRVFDHRVTLRPTGNASGPQDFQWPSCFFVKFIMALHEISMFLNFSTCFPMFLGKKNIKILEWGAITWGQLDPRNSLPNFSICAAKFFSAWPQTRQKVLVSTTANGVESGRCLAV